MATLNILHLANLSGLGGVQKNFIEYFNSIKNTKEINHYLLNLGIISKNLKKNNNIFNFFIIKDMLNVLRIIFFTSSIITIYNRTGSLRTLLVLILFFWKKIILHERGSIWNINNYYSYILVKINYYFSRSIIVNSNATKILLIKKFNLLSNKIQVVHNGVKFSSNIKIQKLKNFKNFKVGFCGRFEFHKNPNKVIEVAEILKDYKDIEFILIGNGSLKKYLIYKSKDFSNIKILNQTDDIDNFYKSLNVLLVPSIREPFGNVIIESGLQGVPVIASYIDGIPEIVKHNFNGILIKPTDKSKIKNYKLKPKYVVEPHTKKLITPKELNPIKISEAILELKKNTTLTKRLSKNMIEHVKKNFSIDKYITKTNSIYHKIYYNENFTHN